VPDLSGYRELTHYHKISPSKFRFPFASQSATLFSEFHLKTLPLFDLEPLADTGLKLNDAQRRAITHGEGPLL